MLRRLTALRLMLTLAAGMLSPVWAGPIHTLILDGPGGWSGPAINWTGTGSYVVVLGPTDVLTDFFTFDLTGYTGTATSGRLRLTRFWSGGPVRFTYTLSDVNLVLFGAGNLYGRITLDAPGAPGDVLDIVLNPQALSDINAARGQFFSLAGRLEPAPVPLPEPSAWLPVAVGLLAGALVYSLRKPRHAYLGPVVESEPAVGKRAAGGDPREKRFPRHQ